MWFVVQTQMLVAVVSTSALTITVLFVVGGHGRFVTQHNKLVTDPFGGSNTLDIVAQPKVSSLIVAVKGKSDKLWTITLKQTVLLPAGTVRGFTHVTPSMDACFSQLILNGTITTTFVSEALTFEMKLPVVATIPRALAVTIFVVSSHRVMAGTMQAATEPGCAREEKQLVRSPRWSSMTETLVSRTPEELQLVTVIR